MDRTKVYDQIVRGLTLIELLVVLAIIGILAVLLLPSAITAIQKAKQKATMQEIMAIATACADYVTDNGQAPSPQSGPMSTVFKQKIVPFYTKSIQSNDQWNNPYYVYTGNAVEESGYGITSDMGFGADDFLIASRGRDATLSAFSYNTDQPDAGLFTLNDLTDFSSDLVNLNGNWISAPSGRVH